MKEERASILSVVNLSKSFGDLMALDRVSFEVKEGEIFGIVGPNGAGKTTLFNIITGGLPGMGQIAFNARNITRLRPHQICQEGVSRTFQLPPYLFSTMSVLENVKIGAHFGANRSRKKGSDDEKEAKDALNLVGLQGKKDTIASSLNLFDRKKAMLAASLATKPRLLLLDEPMGGLSPTEVEEVKRLIYQINKVQSVSVIVIEHLLEVILEICERVMVLNSEVITIETAEKIMEDERVKEVYLKV